MVTSYDNTFLSYTIIFSIYTNIKIISSKVLKNIAQLRNKDIIMVNMTSMKLYYYMYDVYQYLYQI